jgi:hypothetical protein
MEDEINIKMNCKKHPKEVYCHYAVWNIDHWECNLESEECLYVDVDGN